MSTTAVHQLEVSTHIEATPERVWSLLGNPTRVSEFSPEVHKVTWAKGSTVPELGARFRGANRMRGRRWSTSCEITTYEPGREVAWDVTFVLPISQWGYRIEADADGNGCTVVEYFDDRRPAPLRSGLVNTLTRGEPDTVAHNRSGMEHTLAAIKRAAESSS